MRPANWGISTRSAVLSAAVGAPAGARASPAAAVVFVAVLVAGGGLVFVLYRTLLSSVDDAAAGRVRDTVAALNFDTAAELDGSLLVTDQRVVAVQIIGADGRVVQRSDSAPNTPLLPVSTFGPAIRSGISDDASPDNDMRLSGQTADTATGRYTVIAGGGSEAAESTVRTVAVLLMIAAPIISAVAGIVSYRLVKRSLRSVEAIRARVSEITTSDLTERVPVPPQNDEVSALAKTMNEMLARVESGHAAQRRFVGDASHELRNPLASIISALEVAQDYPETVDDDLTSGTLIPEAHRMQALVDDLLAENETARLRRETELAIEISTEEVVVVGDAGDLARVLRNVLDNAVQHAKSAIEIVVERRSDEAVLTVADDGPGIPAEDRARAFDRFVRLDSARSRDGGGSGLGLAIVAEIVSAHGGTVGIDDRPGGGTRVSIVLAVA